MECGNDGNDLVGIDLPRWTQEVQRNNEAKGWYDTKQSFGELCALLHAEVSEAFESWRNNEPIVWVGEGGKPEGVASELADIFIRLVHTADAMGVNLEQAVIQKHLYNQTRPYRHGGKRL